MSKNERKDSGFNSTSDLIRALVPRDAAIPLAPSAGANPSILSNSGTVRGSLANIDAISEQPPRRRSSIMASGITGFDLPRIGKVSEAKDRDEREARFIAKCRACCIVYDLSDPKRDPQGKELKRGALQELCDLLRSTRGILSEPLYPEVINMVAVNAFRALPPLNPYIIPEFDPVAEAEEPTMEVAWPHLQLVYNLFLGMLESPDFNAEMAVKYVDHRFVLQLLQLFDSEDPRERDLLKAIVHRIYGKFLMLRTYIRKQFNNLFYRVIHEVGRHQGLAEILEILGSIINGFAVPLRPEHRLFLFKVLLPLHKLAGLVQFHPQLAYCSVQYLEKDPGLTVELLKQFLRLWPKTDAAKELMFLNEMEELLDVVQPQHFAGIMLPVFRQLALSAASPHFQISQRSLLFFANHYILGLMKSHSAALFPLLYPTLYKISTAHWSQSIHSLAYHTLQIMMEMDQRIFSQCIDQHSAKITEERQMAEKRRHFEMMQKIHKLAQSSPIYPQLANLLRIAPPEMEDYADQRNLPMKYEEWTVTGSELRTRQSQTAINRPNSDRNDLLVVRRQSSISIPSAPPTLMASVNSLSAASAMHVPLSSDPSSGSKLSIRNISQNTTAEKKKSDDSLSQSVIRLALSTLTRKNSGSTSDNPKK